MLPARVTQAIGDIRLILRYLTPYRLRWAWTILLSLLMVGSTLLDPLIIKYLIDDVLAPRAFTLLVPVILLFLAVKIASLLLTYFYGTTYERFVQRVLADLRNDLFDRIEHQRLLFFRKRGVGDLIRALTTDVATVRQILSAGETVILNAIRVLFIFSVSFILSWRISLILLASLPLYVWVQAVHLRWVRRSPENAASADVRLLNFFQERLSNIFLVKLFAQERRELGAEKRLSASWITQSVRLLAAILRTAVMVGFITAAALIATILFGSLTVFSGQIGIGGFVAVVFYAIQLYGPVSVLVSAPAGIQESLVSARRIVDIIATGEEPTAARAPVPRLAGDIRFRRVSFSYPDSPAKPVLENVSFRVRPGETVGITGASGSGKTTILLLLLGFYEPTSGDILLDGRPLRAYPRSFLRRRIGAAPQVPLLLPGTVAENIAYARPAAPREEIERAARLASIHDDIVSRPAGYETPVGPGGSKLSEGEKQRVSLARVFLRNPDLYVFDEPTSALDARNESAVKHSIRAVAAGRTTLLIAHRLSTLEFADRLLVLENGRIVEEGPADELLAQRGAFRSLYCRQFPKDPRCAPFAGRGKT